MDKKRHSVQALATLLQNANIRGFFSGKIYQGELKSICVPGLNCYSCPGAVGACPIGSLQSFLASRPVRIPYYVVGLLIFFGALLGRAVCGFLCPFGFLQELIGMIPFPFRKDRFKADRPLRKLKYVILALTVILPLFVALTPFFCKYICPAGTLAGISLAAADSGIRPLLGALFRSKLCILIIILLLCLVVWRPFCKYLCPLGAIYGCFNRVSVYRLSLDKSACAGCGKCAASCRMCLDPVTELNHAECIRCGACVKSCPASALSMGFKKR